MFHLIYVVKNQEEWEFIDEKLSVKEHSTFYPRKGVYIAFRGRKPVIGDFSAVHWVFYSGQVPAASTLEEFIAHYVKEKLNV